MCVCACIRVCVYKSVKCNTVCLFNVMCNYEQTQCREKVEMNAANIRGLLTMQFMPILPSCLLTSGASVELSVASLAYHLADEKLIASQKR